MSDRDRVGDGHQAAVTQGKICVNAATSSWIIEARSVSLTDGRTKVGERREMEECVCEIKAVMSMLK